MSPRARLTNISSFVYGAARNRISKRRARTALKADQRRIDYNESEKMGATLTFVQAVRCGLSAFASCGVVCLITSLVNRDMKTSVKHAGALAALTLSLAGCVAGGGPEPAAHLSAMQCRDLTAIRNNAPATAAQNRSELAALEAAGYDPSRWYDPYYPDDLQAAQRQVDRWYRTECQQTQTGSVS
jgi:hypothetical protein